jgi:L-fucose isomerase-like protein
MGMKRERALLFGGVPHSYLKRSQITQDFSVVEDKLGIELVSVPQQKLLAGYEGALLRQNTRNELADDIIGASQSMGRAAMQRERVEDAVALYLAMNEMVLAQGASAATIVCRQWIQDEILPVPCISLTLLQERGVPAACQGDVDALLTMMLFKRVANVPSFMGGLFKDNGTMSISHCVLSRKMRGADAPMQGYYLADYHGRKESPTVHTELPEGETVTIARLTKNLEHLILTAGRVIGSWDQEGRCRNTIWIAVDDPDALMNLRVDGQYHFVLACGDHRDELMGFIREAHIGLIDV